MVILLKVMDIINGDDQARIAAMSTSLIQDGPAEALAASQELPLVVLRLGSEAYSLRLHEVREIIMVGNITPIPRAPSFIEGVLNLRGEVMPVIDLRERFGLPRQAVTTVSRIVITPIGGVSTGLIVDSVEEVKSVDQRRLEDPPRVTAVGANAFIEKVARVDQNVIFLLNVQCLLTDVEGQQLRGFQGKKKGLSHE
jgi:purine-binding chemotaxis protein CheW